MVSMVAHTGVAAGVGSAPTESRVDGFGQPIAGLADQDPTTGYRVDSTTRRVVTNEAAAAPSDLPVEPVGLLACDSRADGSDPLHNATRAALHDPVTSAPGQSVTTVAGDVGVHVSTARYHVRVLEGEDLIERRDVDGRSRLSPAQFGDDPELAAAMAEPATATVVGAVRTVQLISVTALAARIDLAPSTASYHVSRLTDAGMFEREKQGKPVYVSLSADASRFLGESPEEGNA